MFRILLLLGCIAIVPTVHLPRLALLEGGSMELYSGPAPSPHEPCCPSVYSSPELVAALPRESDISLFK